ncbi:MAG: hypothetical protein KGL39_31685 [Patescibacteria group bacterium]|nr:hypothetical protein [Patescibacteria group bacterium]
MFLFSRGFDAANSLAEALALVAERDIFAPLDPTPASDILLPGRDFNV